MSRIRFLHTDHLRLGSPLTGLAECPEWLRSCAANAVRRSVANLVEIAIAERCQFVLFAGRITDRPEDQNAASAWLSGLLTQLHKNGIGLVFGSQSSLDQSAFRSLNVTRCGADERLEVSLDERRQLQLRTQRGFSPRGTHPRFFVEIVTTEGRQSLASAGEMIYRAVPNAAPTLSGRPFSDESPVCHDGVISVTAGSPQAISPDERGVFGCRIVDVDTDQRTIMTRVRPTDELRYSREQLPCSSDMATSNLRELILERSGGLGVRPERTTVVDWIVEGQLQAGPEHGGLWDEPALLAELRKRLNGGHAGMWPRRVYFGHASEFSAGSRAGLAVHEFLNVMAVHRSRHLPYPMHSSTNTTASAGSTGNQTAAGLQFLLRAA
jgi:hypothetical protein